MRFWAGLVLCVLISLLPLQGKSQLPPTQCVTTVAASGTGDDIQLPMLPCWPTTTMIILKTAAANLTTTPTITVQGSSPTVVVNYDLTPVAIGLFQPNQYRILAYNGSNWLVMTQSNFNASVLSTNVNDINLYISKNGSDQGTSGVGLNFCNVQSLPCLTILQAVNACFSFNVLGGNCIVNALPGGTNEWDESIFVNGPLFGSGNSFPNPTIGGIQDKGQLIFNGGGTETWNGGSVDCATIGVGDHATVAVMNMAEISGTGSSCQSTGFVQIGGTLNLLGGNTWGSANIGIWHNENSGSNLGIWNDQIISGNAIFLSVTGAQASTLLSAGHLIFAGNPTIGTLFYYEASITQINPANIFEGAATVTDEYQGKYGGQLLFYLTQSPKWPGGSGFGFLYSGARINNASDDSYNTPCIAGNVGCPLVSPAPAGLGTGGTVSVLDGSGPYAGQVNLLTGTGASATGTFYLSFPSILVSDTGANGLCTYMTDIGGSVPGTWTSYAFVRGADNTIGPPSHVAVLWANGLSGSPLAPQVLSDNTNYLVNYNCNN